jgi:hypothetical protein
MCRLSTWKTSSRLHLQQFRTQVQTSCALSRHGGKYNALVQRLRLPMLEDRSRNLLVAPHLIGVINEELCSFHKRTAGLEQAKSDGRLVGEMCALCVLAAHFGACMMLDRIVHTIMVSMARTRLLAYS